MSFWILGAVMAVLAAAVIVLPLWRRGGAQVDHRDGALAIFVDQLKEVEAERKRGLISTEEASAAIVEIKRRMLAIERQSGARVGVTGGAGVLMAAAVLVPALGIGVYMLTGAPGVPSQPFAERAEERGQSDNIVALAERLRARLMNDQSGGPSEGWVLLGQTYMRMGRFSEAVIAFEMVEKRPDVTAGMLTQLAEALVAADDGRVTNRANAVLDRSLEMDPLNPAGSYYKAQWLEQDGRSDKARELLILRLKHEDQEQPWSQTFVEQINRLGEAIGAEPVSLADFVTERAGPDAEDVQAASEMSTEERGDFIRSMVDRLAERLQDEPDDLDGWLQLARAYVVLGERENALSAFRAAEGLSNTLPEGDPRHQVIAEGVAATGG